MSARSSLIPKANNAWLASAVKLQDPKFIEAAWELIKKYPSVEDAVQAIRDSAGHQL